METLQLKWPKKTFDLMCSLALKNLLLLNNANATESSCKTLIIKMQFLLEFFNNDKANSIDESILDTIKMALKQYDLSLKKQ
jgi:hypothetical protein